MKLKLFIETIDKECLIASTYMDPSDSLFGACHVFRIVGKNAMRSIIVARMTDHSILLVKSHGRIDITASIRHALSNKAISFVPYLNERQNIIVVSSAAAPVAQEPGPPFDTHCPRNAIVVTIDQINHVYI